MSVVFNIQEAKNQLSRILRRAEEGEDVVIARDGNPIVRLVPVVAPADRPVGFVEGQLTAAFFDELPDDELDRWE